MIVQPSLSYIPVFTCEQGADCLHPAMFAGCAESLLVVAVAVVLSGANAVGFTKCSKDAKQSMNNIATNAIRSHITDGLGRMNPFSS